MVARGRGMGERGQKAHTFPVNETEVLGMLMCSVATIANNTVLFT